MESIRPPRKILLVVTTGGFTHAAPVLEIGKLLAERGHVVDFATLDGQESYIKDYPFISQLHLLGVGPTEQQYTEHYLRMRKWDMAAGLKQAMPSKYLWDSFWPLTFHGLKAIMDDPVRRPDFIVADFFADAVKDIHLLYHVQIAVMWPQMPFLMLPCSYIPGQPGFQLDGTLTSEDASLWLRIKNEWVVWKALPELLKWTKWMKAMRRREGVNYMLPSVSKPDYLIFINTFFGLEVPRDLPPTAMAVGPVLSDEYPPLDEQCGQFLATHQKVMYIALGTHVILANEDVAKIINAALRLIQDGLLDGVIWAVGKSARQDMNPDHTFQDSKGEKFTLGSLLEGNNPDFIFPFFAPQRAVLEHPAVQLYFTHGGGSSANEGLYHGKRMLCMGIFSDQIANSARLVYGGVAEALNKFTFTSEDVYAHARTVLEDEAGNFSRNALRLQRIAHLASRRKHYATDLIEEVMYDHELRWDKGKELRPMHLQTADMRMTAWKAQNWDLRAVVGMGTIFMLAATIWAGKLAWRHLGSLEGYVSHLRGFVSSKLR